MVSTRATPCAPLRPHVENPIGPGSELGNELGNFCTGSYELMSKNADFAACQRSVQCCKIGEKLLVNAEMGGLTPPAVLARRYSCWLPFVSIDGTRLGSSAFPLLWRSQKMDRFVDWLKRRIIFSRWNSKIVWEMGKSRNQRWTILWLICSFILFWNKFIFDTKKTDRIDLYSQYFM